MQTPTRLELEGWSDLTILYPLIFQLSSSNAVSELRKVLGKQITSNLWIEI